MHTEWETFREKWKRNKTIQLAEVIEEGVNLGLTGGVDSYFWVWLIRAGGSVALRFPGLHLRVPSNP